MAESAALAESKLAEWKSQRKFSSADLGRKSRRDLQALAKEYGIGANQKSTMIIAKILKQQILSKDFEEPESDSQMLHGISREVKKQFEELSRVCQKIHELLNLAGLPVTDAEMYGGYDEYMKFTEDAVDYYGEARRTMETELDFLASFKSELFHFRFPDKAAKSVAQPLVEEVSAAPVRVKAKKVQLTAPAKPFAVKVPVTAVRYVAISVDGVPETVENEEIQAEFDTKALVGRFKSGLCKVLVLESEVGRALSQKSVSGHKIRVKTWRVKDHHRNGRYRRQDGRGEDSTIEKCMESVNIIGTRVKFIEDAMNDMKRLLKRIASTDEDSEVSSY